MFVCIYIHLSFHFSSSPSSLGSVSFVIWMVFLSFFSLLEIKGSLLLTAIAVARVSSFLFFHFRQIQFLQGDRKRSCDICTRGDALQERNPELREHTTFKMGDKPTLTLPYGETLFSLQWPVNNSALYYFYLPKLFPI